MRIITTEEHLAGTPIHRHLAKYAAEDAPYGAMARIKGRPFDPDPVLFTDLDQRIRDLDRHGITMQILSCPVKSQLLPPGEAPALVRETNDYVWAAVQRHPDRYGAFALLPWSAPAEAVSQAADRTAASFRWYPSSRSIASSSPLVRKPHSTSTAGQET